MRGVWMSAMTMNYAVDEEDVLKNIKVGDQIGDRPLKDPVCGIVAHNSETIKWLPAYPSM